jgi:hypothetical protein
MSSAFTALTSPLAPPTSPDAIFIRIAQLDTPHRSTVFRLRSTQFSLSGTVPGSVAAWKTMCSGEPPVSAMEMSAGLRCEAGRESRRSRSAVPRVQAVAAVKVRKV